MPPRNGFWPRISLVTPSFNQGTFLERTIQSVLSQRYPNLEYLIMDGGSSDESVAIITRYAEQLAHWESQPDKGQSHAINKGFARSTGDIMAWLNADDILLPNALHAVGQIFRDFPHIQWLTSGSINLDADDRLFFLQPPQRYYARWTQFFNHAPPPQPCTFWRRSLWDQAGGSVTEQSRFMDCELWLRFYEHAPLYIADTVFGAWRAHPSSYSLQQRAHLHAEIDAAQRPHLARFLDQRWWLKPCTPMLRRYFARKAATVMRPSASGVVNRLFFEWRVKPHRFLSFDMSSGRFTL